MKCHCGSDLEFSKCCELYLSDKETPESAEKLMRSRYSAYCVKNLDYLVQTTDPQARFEIDSKANADWAEQAQFTKLEIINAEESGTKSIVEFKAQYTFQNENHIHHEVSTFRKTGGVWYFRSGRIIKPKE